VHIISHIEEITLTNYCYSASRSNCGKESPLEIPSRQTVFYSLRDQLLSCARAGEYFGRYKAAERQLCGRSPK
jgi:hypothetical protein